MQFSDRPNKGPEFLLSVCIWLCRLIFGQSDPDSQGFIRYAIDQDRQYMSQHVGCAARKFLPRFEESEGYDLVGVIVFLVVIQDFAMGPLIDCHELSLLSPS